MSDTLLFEPNMGLAKLEFWRLIIHRPKPFIALGVLMLLILALCVTLQNYWLSGLLIPCFGAIEVLRSRAKGLFYDCDVNIGKVLSRKDRLYAVAANLGRVGGPDKIAIKIVKGSVPKADGYDYPDGAYFGAVCYYPKAYPGVDVDMSFIKSEPISAGTSNPKTLKFQHDYLQTHIKDFEKFLALVPAVDKPTIYLFDRDAVNI